MFVVLIIIFVYLAASRLFHLTLLDDEHDLYNVTGVKSSEFDVLCNRFEEDLLTTTLHEPYRRKDCKRGKVREISTRSQIFLFLIWIRHYPVERLLAWIFALNKKLTIVLHSLYSTGII
jgi:hypothetical protein